MTKTQRVLQVLKALATNRVTYRFLAAVLLAAGFTAGAEWTGKLETIVCTVVAECN